MRNKEPWKILNWLMYPLKKQSDDPHRCCAAVCVRDSNGYKQCTRDWVFMVLTLPFCQQHAKIARRYLEKRNIVFIQSKKKRVESKHQWLN